MENQITHNFKLQDFFCKDGTPVPQHLYYNMRVIAGALECLRGWFQSPIIINSAFRTVRYNQKIGGAKNSYHLTMQAVDIVVKNAPPAVVAEVIYSFMQKKLIPAGAVILYNNFVHYDTRGYILKLDYRK